MHLSLHFQKVTKHLARSHPGNKQTAPYYKWKSWSEPREGHSLQAVNVSSEKCFWLPSDPFSDVIQTPPNFYTTRWIKFCSEITFALSFTSAFLLPVKNHGCVGWLCKDDIPRQEFLLGFQTPAFAFSCEHFHWLHSSFGHPRNPKAWEVGISEQAKSPVTPVNLDVLQGHAYNRRAGLPPPLATSIPIGGRGGGSRRGRSRRSSAQYRRPMQGRDGAGISASLGKPSPKVTLGKVSPNHKKLYILQLSLIYTLPLEGECILFAGYF